MIAAGLATGDEAHLRPGLPRRHALGDRPRPGEALRAHPLPARPLRADLLRPGQRHPQPGLRQRRHLQSHPEPRGHRVLRPLEGRLRHRPGHADHGPEGHHPGRARRARRPRRQVPHPAHALTRALVRHINALTPADFKTITLDRPGRAQQAESARGHRNSADQLPRHRPPARRHRPRPRRPHRDHHQRPRRSPPRR